MITSQNRWRVWRQDMIALTIIAVALGVCFLPWALLVVAGV